MLAHWLCSLGGKSWEGFACLFVWFVCPCFLLQINLMAEVCVTGRDFWLCAQRTRPLSLSLSELESDLDHYFKGLSRCATAFSRPDILV